VRLAIAAIGKLKAGPERELAERYRDRAAKAGRSLGFKAVDVIEIGESRAQRTEDRIAEEGAALLKHAAETNIVRIALDETGTSLGSEEFAGLLGRWKDGGRTATVFAIGGPDGLSPAFRSKSELTWSFGAATWPHQLVRIMLLEQLYRAITILSGHPYHRS
jgi:23S rRNA (pseudouridine1915-N3)-methyltransferase